MTKEEIFELILSWENLPLLIAEAEKDPGYLPILLDIAISNQHPKSWRAAWVADKVHDRHPEWITPYLPQMIRQLRSHPSDAIKRHFLKFISLHEVPVRHHPFLMDYCLDRFTSSDEPVSVRVYAMQILCNIAEREPDFKPELRSIIEHEMELHPTPGILSRGKRLMKQLTKKSTRYGKDPTAFVR